MRSSVVVFIELVLCATSILWVLSAFGIEGVRNETNTQTEAPLNTSLTLREDFHVHKLAESFQTAELQPSKTEQKT